MLDTLTTAMTVLAYIGFIQFLMTTVTFVVLVALGFNRDFRELVYRPFLDHDLEIAILWMFIACFFWPATLFVLGWFVKHDDLPEWMEHRLARRKVVMDPVSAIMMGDPQRQSPFMRRMRDRINQPPTR